MATNLSAMQKTRVPYLDHDDPLEKGMATHSSFLPGKSHGQRNLEAIANGVTNVCDTAEQLTLSELSAFLVAEALRQPTFYKSLTRLT